MKAMPKFALLIVLLVGLPMLGVALAGKPVSRYLEFPPLTRYVEHAPFSTPSFIGLTLFMIAVIAPFLLRIVNKAQTAGRSPKAGQSLLISPTLPKGLSHTLTSSWPRPAFFQATRSLLIPPPPKRYLTRYTTLPLPRRARTRLLFRALSLPGQALSRWPRSFPWWGWVGLGLVAIAWVLAWTRFAWFADLQPFTFTPLWIGYILIVNALTFGRTGSCLIVDRPREFLSLFPFSAAFWWFFEYLNRFVQNWYYVGVSDFAPWEYALHATVPFSTVLPAVLSTAEWLHSFPRLTGPLYDLWPVRIGRSRMVGGIVLMLASAGLMGIGIWPDYLFPLLWVSPLLIIMSLQALLGLPTVFSTLTVGDWRPVWLPALAGLICGFFWEMWNSNSLAHWEYAVPYVHRIQIFEMPVLGYAGYLPFGLECKVIADLLLQKAS